MTSHPAFPCGRDCPPVCTCPASVRFQPYLFLYPLAGAPHCYPQCDPSGVLYWQHFYQTDTSLSLPGSSLQNTIQLNLISTIGKLPKRHIQKKYIMNEDNIIQMSSMSMILLIFIYYNISLMKINNIILVLNTCIILLSSFVIYFSVYVIWEVL